MSYTEDYASQEPVETISGVTKLHVRDKGSKYTLTPATLEWVEGRQFECKEYTSKPSKESSKGTKTTYVYDQDVELLPYMSSPDYTLHETFFVPPLGSPFKSFFKEPYYTVEAKTSSSTTLVLHKELGPYDIQRMIATGDWSPLRNIRFRGRTTLDLSVLYKDVSVLDEIVKVHGNNAFRDATHLIVADQCFWSRIKVYSFPKLKHLTLITLDEEERVVLNESIETLNIGPSPYGRNVAEVLDGVSVKTIVSYPFMDDFLATLLLQKCRHLILECAKWTITERGKFRDRSSFSITIPDMEEVTTRYITYRIYKARGAPVHDTYNYSFRVHKKRRRVETTNPSI